MQVRGLWYGQLQRMLDTIELGREEFPCRARSTRDSDVRKIAPQLMSDSMFICGISCLVIISVLDLHGKVPGFAGHMCADYLHGWAMSEAVPTVLHM